MSKKRKNISKRVRFEVFKRDAFTCQYCGAHPPEAVLHVDHITPVALGGENDDDNLVTSCAACNLGKSDKSLKDVPATLAQKAADVAEREEQIAGYNAVMQAKRDRIEDELWRVAEVIDPGSSVSGMSRDWTASIRRFNEKLGVFTALEAAEIARSRHPYGGKQTFLYFCGICWRKIRESEGA